MIIEGLLNAIYNLLNGILSSLNIPGMPPEMETAFSEFFVYLGYAKNLIGLVLPINLTPYFVVFFAIFGFEHLYPVIMWILRKIPMLGIE